MSRTRSQGNQADGSRFQRSDSSGPVTWGVAPGYDEDAPLALKTARPVAVRTSALRAEGAVVKDSLGQRPRYSRPAETAALKARFIPRVTWRVVPGYDEDAPLALKGARRFRAEGATINYSLGQRPRISTPLQRAALKARLILGAV
jgi:hypothetical protein